MAALPLLPGFLYSLWCTYHPGFFKTLLSHPFIILLPTFVPFSFSSSSPQTKCCCCIPCSSCCAAPYTPSYDRPNLRFYWRYSIFSCILHTIVPLIFGGFLVLLGLIATGDSGGWALVVCTVATSIAMAILYGLGTRRGESTFLYCYLSLLFQ